MRKIEAKGDMLMGIQIVTDSACDLSREVIEYYDIKVMPLMVYRKEAEYEDGVSIVPKSVLDGMREGEVFRTAQVPVQRIMEMLNQSKCREFIYIAFSSELSGTYATACMVLENLKEDDPGIGDRMRIIDSRCASGGMGLVVLKAAQMAKAGLGFAEIEEMANYYSRHMQHVFTVDQIEYLYKGGRVTKTQAFIGGLLNVKPILDVQDGRLVPMEIARGRKHLYKRMLEIIEERGVNLENQVIGINHGDDLEAAQRIMGLMKEKFHVEHFLCNTIGCAIGAHSGPGTLAIFFMDEQAPMGFVEPFE